MKEVLVSLTTAGNPDWRKNVDDLKKMNVKRFALFLTMMPDADERMKLFQTIKKEMPGAKIPFAHIRPDITPIQLDFLIDNFGLEKMNIHPTREYPLVHDYAKYMKMVYIENAGPAIKDGLKESDLAGFAGVCLDISHLENAKRMGYPGYKITLELLKRNTIGANHISGILEKPFHGPISGTFSYDSHKYTKLSDFDYLKNYGSEFFGQYIALELYNSIEEQLKAKKYIESIIGDKL